MPELFAPCPGSAPVLATVQPRPDDRSSDRGVMVGGVGL